jgi:hypothetical protein
MFSVGMGFPYGHAENSVVTGYRFLMTDNTIAGDDKPDHWMTEV